MDLTEILAHPPRILVADDDYFTRDILRNYLENAGCEVVDFDNGGDAGRAMRDGYEPDLALLDIQMPQLDGLTLCRQMKSDQRTRLIPVIIVTAFDAEDEKLNAIESGADDFVGKPFNATVLITRVRSLLRLKRLYDDLENNNNMLSQLLTRYVAPEIAGVILTDPENYLKLGGQNRFVTILYADLRGFTRFTETRSADVVVETLNMLFTRLSEPIYANGGTLDKYLGDAIQSFWGAPLQREDDAHWALRAALGMQGVFREIQEEPAHEVLKSLGLGIGVHTGEAIVGNIGSERVMDYTVIGDTANIARRLQEMARPGEILISQATLRQVPAARIRPLTVQALPGRLEPVAIYRLLRLRD
ncbi:MAG TPA: adenylate/guanylate cyclase domain-containing protein [Anaerolineales bacterium]|nr:adenylate/guanylate cyclase domain-containing protein [Anaerolineales bacterium]